MCLPPPPSHLLGKAVELFADLKDANNGTMSADIFKRKMALATQLKLIFLAFKWAVSCLQNCVQFLQESIPCK